MDIVAKFFVVTWLVLSLGTPMLTSLYIQQLGKCVGLISLGESGGVSKNSETLVVDESSDYFIKDMEISGVFPFFVALGPFAIPVSVIFGVSASIDFLVYVLRNHSIDLARAICGCNLCFVASPAAAPSDLPSPAAAPSDLPSDP